MSLKWIHLDLSIKQPGLNIRCVQETGSLASMAHAQKTAPTELDSGAIRAGAFADPSQMRVLESISVFESIAKYAVKR